MSNCVVKRGRKRKLKESENESNSNYDHITEQDLELKEFKCPRCSLTFVTTNDLFVHMREKYTHPTICHLCSKDLKALPNLLSHSYLHSGIKPYKCPKCDYATRTRFNLKVHFGACAKLEKFSYKRGQNQKRRKLTQKNKNKSRTSSNKNENRINNTKHVSDEILHRIPDTGPALNTYDRDISGLIQVHIQHLIYPANNHFQY